MNNLVYNQLAMYFPLTLEVCFKTSDVITCSSEGHPRHWMTRTLEPFHDEVVNVEVSGKKIVEGEWMSS